MLCNIIYYLSIYFSVFRDGRLKFNDLTTVTVKEENIRVGDPATETTSSTNYEKNLLSECTK